MKRNLRILLADDDPDEAIMFRDCLKVLNLDPELRFVHCGNDLFKSLETEGNADLIIVDVQMPDMGGLECLKTIKSHPVYRKIPVVMMAVSRNPVDIEDAYRLGAHHYVVKPYSQSNYVSTLYRLFLVDWRAETPLPSRENFVINLAFA